MYIKGGGVRTKLFVQAKKKGSYENICMCTFGFCFQMFRARSRKIGKTLLQVFNGQGRFYDFRNLRAATSNHPREI